jgi:hypothetical protein
MNSGDSPPTDAKGRQKRSNKEMKSEKRHDTDKKAQRTEHGNGNDNHLHAGPRLPLRLIL